MNACLSRTAKILIAVALFTTLISRVPPAKASADVILWDYKYDGENLEIQLMNIGDNSTKVYVSLRDSAGVIVGYPLYNVGAMDGNWGSNASTLTFKLPENYRSVNVVFEYYVEKGVEITKVKGQETIYLPEVTKPFRVSLSSSTPSVQAELDGTASYQVTLTNEGEAGHVDFIVRGLPSSITPGFYIGSQKILSVALEKEESKTLTLYLYLPSSPSGFEVGKEIGFDVFALNENQMEAYKNGASLDNLGASTLRLYLIPEGAPALGLSLENQFARVKAGEEIHTTAMVSNTGTQPAEDVELNVKDLPYGWSIFINPDKISSIDAGEKTNVDVIVVLSDDAAPGRYEFTITATSGSYSASKSFEVRVEETGSSQILWMFAIIFAVIIVAGIMVKFRRR